MIKNEEIKERLFKEISALSERILRQESPVDQWPILPEVTPYYLRKYLQYKDRLDNSVKEQIFEAQVISARHMIKSSIFGFGQVPAFNDLYPSYMKTLDDFRLWIKKVESAEEKIIVYKPSEKGLKVSVIIKSLMSRDFSDYQYDKSLSNGSATAFTKDCGLYKLLIMFDRGTIRQFIDVFIGVHPFFQMDIVYLLGAGQSCFEYHNEETLKESTQKAIDYLKFIWPHYEKAIERAFK